MLLSDDRSDPDRSRLVQALQARGGRVVHAQRGMALDLGSGARLEVVEERDGNLTLLLITGKARIALLPRARASEPLASLTGVVIPNPSSIGWLGEMDIPVAVVHGANPMPNHPSMLATEDRGWVELETDGEQLWIRTQHAGQ